MTAILPLGGADDCPVCGANHTQRDEWPADWPACPTHGHLLTEYQVTDAGIEYRCPAWKCRHTHTQSERPAMTATETATAALAIRGGQDFWDAKQLAALAQLGIKDASNADLAVFMHYCQKTGLDPFSRQIYMIGRKDKTGTVRQTIQVGIDGYRVIAQRAARRDGVTLSYGNTTWYDDSGQPYDVWVSPVPPAAASVTVYRDGRPFPGVARFAAFAARTKDGQLMGLWASMGDHLIAKCAEAQALRKAFPHDLVGIQTDDETAHYGNPAPTVVRAVPTATAAPPRRPKEPTAATAAARPAPAARPSAAERQPDEDTVIDAEWERLGITDPDERLNLTAELAGTAVILDSLDNLLPEEAHRVAGLLAGCDDLGQVHALLEGGDKPGQPS